MYIQFYGLNKNGTDRVEAGKVFLNDNGEVVFDQVSSAIEKENETLGIMKPDGNILYPSDGEEFLKALPQNYNGSYFWAVLIEDQ
jgi:hypothetical protein